MSFFERVLQVGRRIDHAVYTKTGIHKVVGAIKGALPPGVRRVGARYGPFVAIVSAVAIFAAALTGGDTGSRIRTGERGALGPGEKGGVIRGSDSSPTPGGSGQTDGNAAGGAGATFAGQVAAPPTANVCGDNGLLQTGTVVQYPYAVQCLDTFTGDNGGDVSRGVFRDKIRVVQYITTDPQIKGTTAAGGGCAVDQQEGCWIDYMKAYSEWHAKYYQTYGRVVEIIPFRGRGRENNVDQAIQDARDIAGINPPVFAVLGGPGEAGGSFASELKSKGIICFCTVSLPQEYYEEHAPFVWGTLMSSTQAYIHRAEYVGKRLAGRKAIYAKEPTIGEPDLTNMKRVFGLVWFNNSQDQYASGVEFFKKELAKYGVKLKIDIEYTNIEGCQRDALDIVTALRNAGVTSTIFSGDPICPITLTDVAEAQGADWEWIITGSVLSDSNNLARLYQRDQWARAFGVSMLSPDVKNANDYWYKMYKEMRPQTEPKEDGQLFVSPATMLYTGIHLAGANLNPNTFRDGLATAIPRGGTPTVPLQSWGPKKLGDLSLFDTLRFDDMTEIWWDNTAEDANGNDRAYRYVNGGQRHAWGTWPSTNVTAFNKEGTVTGYDKPPDQ